MKLSHPGIDKREYLHRAIYPTLFLVLAIALTIVYHLVFLPRSTNLDTLLFYSALAIITFTLVVLFQRFINDPSFHIPLSVGWGLVFLASVEKLNAELLNTVNFENENFFTGMIAFGLALSAIGFYKWTQHMWKQDRYREQQNRVIQLYNSLMTHDAGNDLQAVLGYIEAALMTPEGCSSETIRLLEAAEAATLRMAGLIKAFKPDEFESEQALVPLLRNIAIQAEKADLQLKTKFYAQPGTENLKVAGATLLQIALSNLLRNTAKYSGDSPVAEITIFRNNENLVVTMSDRGPGIPEGITASIFERGGSNEEHGLGLYLTKQIIKACSGTIEFVDTPIGATFRIILPIAG
jgi:signal transduction histidine kinase